jgi:hypothetical protein
MPKQSAQFFHTLESGHPGSRTPSLDSWIPACAGMTVNAAARIVS